MNPGEFVRWNGRSVRALMIQCRYQDGYEAIIGPDSPDYALAVAALQALIQPRPTVPLAGVHPGVGLRYCGEEAPLAEWISHGVKVRYVDGVVAIRDHIGGWKANSWQTDAFNAGREYERRQG